MEVPQVRSVLKQIIIVVRTECLIDNSGQPDSPHATLVQVPRIGAFLELELESLDGFSAFG